MASSPLISSPQLSRLKEASHLLHLIVHRNKNQHRAARWWKWVIILRREIRKLVTEAERGVDGVARERAKSMKVEERMEYLRKEVVERAYWAFTTVVADRQYASLGVVLVGVLASVGRVVRFKAEEVGVEEDGDREVEAEDGGEDAGVRVERSRGDSEGENVEDGKKDEKEEERGGEEVRDGDQRGGLGGGDAVLAGVEDGLENEEKRTVEDHDCAEDDGTRNLEKQSEKRDREVKKDMNSGEVEVKTRKEKLKKRKKGAAGDIDDLFSGLV